LFLYKNLFHWFTKKFQWFIILFFKFRFLFHWIFFVTNVFTSRRKVQDFCNERLYVSSEGSGFLQRTSLRLVGRFRIFVTNHTTPRRMVQKISNQPYDTSSHGSFSERLTRFEYCHPSIIEFYFIISATVLRKSSDFCVFLPKLNTCNRFTNYGELYSIGTQV
jgi:hypothetical protein